MENLEKTTDNFTSQFTAQLTDLIAHDFIAKKQSEFLATKKEELQPNEFIVISDFAENYSFAVQDEAQGWHWANAQCTIHPFAIYFKGENDNKINYQSLIIIAESLKHNFESVYQFQLVLIDFLKQKFETIQKIFFFSDGAASQYKNKKNFFSLCQFKKRHGFEVEWHFFATSHGKGPCDGVGGAFKRNATRASLQRPFSQQITDAKTLYEWAIDTKSDIVFRYCTNGEYKKMESRLKKTFLKVQAITGTQKFHSFIPIDNNRTEARRFSFSNECEVFNMK